VRRLLKLRTDQPVDAVGVDLGVDERDVVSEVRLSVQDGGDRRGTAAVNTCRRRDVSALKRSLKLR